MEDYNELVPICSYWCINKLITGLSGTIASRANFLPMPWKQPWTAVASDLRGRVDPRGRDLGRLGGAELAARGETERPDDFDADLRGVQLVPNGNGWSADGVAAGSHFWWENTGDRMNR